MLVVEERQARKHLCTLQALAAHGRPTLIVSGGERLARIEGIPSGQARRWSEQTLDLIEAALISRGAVRQP